MPLFSFLCSILGAPVRTASSVAESSSQPTVSSASPTAPINVERRTTNNPFQYAADIKSASIYESVGFNPMTNITFVFGNVFYPRSDSSGIHNIPLPDITPQGYRSVSMQLVIYLILLSELPLLTRGLLYVKQQMQPFSATAIQ
jgi:hypothetical protein